jgi:cysteine desulfurase
MNTEAPIYLDHNATTPIHPEVVDAMLPYLREHFGNPSSSHLYGRRAHDGVARARGQVAGLLGCDDDEVIFTSGGTEANNLAIRGVVEARIERRHVVTTVIEHPATERPCAWLEQHGLRLTRIGVDVDGQARVEEARAAIAANTALVTVMHSNNETGVLQPVVEFTQLAHAVGESASAVILAMGVAPDEAVGSVRLTLGRGTSPAEIVTAADALARSWRGARRAPGQVQTLSPPDFGGNPKMDR